jgi:hypothetical protein
MEHRSTDLPDLYFRLAYLTFSLMYGRNHSSRVCALYLMCMHADCNLRSGQLHACMPCSGDRHDGDK